MKCFYHSADLDGHCSGAIVKHEYPDCEMIPFNYGDDFPWEKVKPGETVFMVDLSLDDIADMIGLHNHCNFLWIDHHKSAIEKAKRAPVIFKGLQREGIGACALTWEFVKCNKAGGINHPVPYAVRLLAEYDVWNHSDDRVLPFQYGMRLEKDTRPDNQYLWNRVLDNGYFVDNCVERGKIVLEYERNQNEKCCASQAFETVLTAPDGKHYKALAVNRGFINSTFFDSRYVPAKHDIMIRFYTTGEGVWNVGLNTGKAGIDCADIALQFGGGGHKGAAGFQIKELPFKY